MCKNRGNFNIKRYDKRVEFLEYRQVDYYPCRQVDWPNREEGACFIEMWLVRQYEYRKQPVPDEDWEDFVSGGITRLTFCECIDDSGECKFLGCACPVVPRPAPKKNWEILFMDKRLILPGGVRGIRKAG